MRCQQAKQGRTIRIKVIRSWVQIMAESGIIFPGYTSPLFSLLDQLTDVGRVVATRIQIVSTEDLSIDWVPVLVAQRSEGEIGTHLNPSSDYDRAITSKVCRLIGQPELSITITLRDYCSGRIWIMQSCDLQCCNNDIIIKPSVQFTAAKEGQVKSASGMGS